MTFISDPTKRLFAVFGGPSVSDPAWQIKCSELNADGSVKVNFSSLDPLKHLLEELEPAD